MPRRVFLLLASATALAACVAGGVRVPLDEAAWARAARIELIYVADAAPRVEYLPEPMPSQTPEPSAVGGEAGDVRCGAAGVAATQGRPRLAAWVWEARAARADPAAFARRAVAAGVDTVFLQLEPDPERQAPLLEALAAAGVRVLALDGYADAAIHPQALEHDVAAIRRYNARHTIGFAGLQVDVEPYLLPGYRLEGEAVFARYLALLASLRAQLGPGLEFSAAIPFWYAGEQVAGRDLVESVIEATDSVAVMTYRTRRAQVEELARPTLCLAARHGHGAWVGLESTRLASEVHLVLAKAQLEDRVRHESGRLVLRAGEGLPVASRYVVQADELSFHSAPQALRALLAEPLPYAAFQGWAVNGLLAGRGGALLR